MSGRGRKKNKPFMDHHPIPESLLQPVSKASKKPSPSIKAQTPRQKVYLNKIQKNQHDILLATGPAGTGKTYIPTVIAIKLLQAGAIDKIIITRPNVGAGDDLGFLPGNLIEKMAPWMTPIIDVFKEFYEVHEVNRMLADEIIEIAPLVYMRGRTLKNAFVIADEMQNSTVEQMQMFLTRIGENSRYVITGDMEQHDRGNSKSGLADFIERWQRNRPPVEMVPANDEDEHEPIDEAAAYYTPAPQHTRERIGYIRFGREDVVRHAVIEEVLALYAA